MAYPDILSRRMPYDIDGSEVGWNTGSSTLNSYELGITNWLDSTAKGALNNTLVRGPNLGWRIHMWVFFPEKREIEAVTMYSGHSERVYTMYDFQGSNDTTNGMDGTWETAVIIGNPMIATWSPGAVHEWRNRIIPVSFSQPYKVIRFRGYHAYGTYLQNLYLYGKTAATELEADILIMDNEREGSPEFVSLKDWGDMAEGTTRIQSIRLKNSSNVKMAHHINVQLNADGYSISFSPDGPWGTFVDIESISPNSISAPIYIKNQIGVPLQILRPLADRLVVKVESMA